MKLDMKLIIIIVAECLLIVGFLLLNYFFPTFKRDHSRLVELPMTNALPSIQNDNFILPEEAESRETKFNGEETEDGDGITFVDIIEVSKKNFYYPDNSDSEIMFSK